MSFDYDCEECGESVMSMDNGHRICLGCQQRYDIEWTKFYRPGEEDEYVPASVKKVGDSG